MKQWFVLLLAGGLALGSPLTAEPLETGSPLPAVSAPDQSGEIIELGPDLSGYVLVYFYPKADTPGCTSQACSLRDAYAALEEAGVRVFGVSMDSVPEQRAFKEKYALPFTLIADADGQVVEAFGVPARGRFAARQAFLFRDGRLVWRDLSASTARQAEDVLAVLAERS